MEKEMVDLERRDKLRREDDKWCHDHETRLAILERSMEQLIVRTDRNELILHAIEKSVSKLEDEMRNHIALMKQHIDLAFKQHEMTEMEMHKAMLVQAIKATAGGLTFLAAALGTTGWWIVQHLLGAG